MNDFFKITPKKRTVKIKTKKGIIYNNPSKEKKWLFYFGTLAIFISVGEFGYIYEPLVKDWINYKKIDQNKVTQLIEETKKEILLKESKPLVEPTISVDPKNEIKTEEKPVIKKEDNSFDIQIPKIGARAKIAIGVSPYDKKEYTAILKDNVIAQSNISSLPGEGKGTTTYLFAHSSEQSMLAARQNSVFYLLGELNNDDTIMINYRGNDYMYKVYTKKIIGPKETEYLTYSERDREILILQTCWPIGTNWQRLLVFAERI